MGPLLASDSTTVWVPAECEVLAALSAVQTVTGLLLRSGICVKKG